MDGRGKKDNLREIPREREVHGIVKKANAPLSKTPREEMHTHTQSNPCFGRRTAAVNANPGMKGGTKNGQERAHSDQDLSIPLFTATLLADVGAPFAFRRHQMATKLPAAAEQQTTTHRGERRNNKISKICHPPPFSFSIPRERNSKDDDDDGHLILNHGHKSNSPGLRSYIRPKSLGFRPREKRRGAFLRNSSSQPEKVYVAL